PACVPRRNVAARAPTRSVHERDDMIGWLRVLVEGAGIRAGDRVDVKVRAVEAATAEVGCAGNSESALVDVRIETADGERGVAEVGKARVTRGVELKANVGVVRSPAGGPGEDAVRAQLVAVELLASSRSGEREALADERGAEVVVEAHVHGPAVR